MSIDITGIVQNGVIVPSVPLPEGTQVEIHVNGEAAEQADAQKNRVPSPAQKQPRTSLADWAEAKGEHWGSQLSSEDVEGFTGRRF